MKIIVTIISVVFLLSLTGSSLACTFIQPTEPYISGLTLTNNPNIIKTSIIYSASNHTDLILDLQNKIIRRHQNESFFIPIPDQDTYSLSYTTKLSNNSVPLIYSISLFNNTQQLLLNVTMDSIGLQNFTEESFHWYSYSHYLVSKKYNRFYLFDFQNESVSMDITHPVEDHNKVSFTNLDYYGFKFVDTYDNSGLLYSGGGMQTTCLGNYYYGYNKTNIWGIDRINYAGFQSLSFDPRIGSLVKINGLEREIIIENTLGEITYSWNFYNEFNATPTANDNSATSQITTSVSITSGIILITISSMSLVRKRYKNKKNNN